MVATLKRIETVSAEARLAALIGAGLDRADRGEAFATRELNAFFAASCPGLPLPWEWRWSYGCPRGQLAARVRHGVIAWADACGSGVVEAEPAGGGEVMVQADCWAYAQRFTVWGYVADFEVEAIPRFARGRSM